MTGVKIVGDEGLQSTLPKMKSTSTSETVHAFGMLLFAIEYRKFSASETKNHLNDQDKKSSNF